MSDVLSIVSAAIITKLKANSTLVAALGTSTNFWLNAAPPKILDTTFPYVQLLHTSGGIMNDAPYDSADVEFMVVGTALTSAQAETLAGYISQSLHKQDLTYGEGWRAWSTARQTDSYSRQVTIQQTQYNQSGGYYRFRISRG